MRRRNLVDLQKKLQLVKADLAAHPYNSPEAIRIREITDQLREKGPEFINQELSKKGLPSLADAGKIVIKGLRSFAKLHRKKHKLEKKISLLGAKD